MPDTLHSRPLTVIEANNPLDMDEEMLCLRSAGSQILESITEGTQIARFEYDAPDRKLRAWCTLGASKWKTAWIDVPTPGEHAAYEISRHTLQTLGQKEGQQAAERVSERLYKRFRS